LADGMTPPAWRTMAGSPFVEMESSNAPASSLTLRARVAVSSAVRRRAG
jgi:hypothetical protein